MQRGGEGKAERTQRSVANVGFPNLVPVREFKELRVYQQAYDAAPKIFEASRDRPKAGTHSLTDQIRRSSCSVWANIAEAWRKRRCEKHFVSKPSDADAEAAETRTWLQFGEDTDASPMKRLKASIAPTTKAVAAW